VRCPLFLSHVDPFSINRECVDADFRFMAASDLTNELLSPSMEPTLNDSVSYKVVEAVLNTLQDKNGEVQNMGVKWYSIEEFWVDYSLSALVPRLKEQQVQMIVDRLSHFTDASNQNAELRDISSTGTHSLFTKLTIALRTVIIEIPSNTQLSHILIAQLLPRLQSQVCLSPGIADIAHCEKCIQYDFPRYNSNPS
jgi:hypothetical protein